MSLTYEVRTYGCQMNVHDSERISGLLESAGYVLAQDDNPDLVVFNTCAVRENADNKLYGNLGHLAPVKARKPGISRTLCARPISAPEKPAASLARICAAPCSIISRARSPM